MGCCIAIAMVIALVRGAWFRLFPHRRPPESGFAPPAYRAAPGTVGDAPAAPLPAAPVLVAPVSVAPWPALAFGSAAVAVACYAATVQLLSAAGLAHSAPPPGRHLLFVALGLGALLAAALCSGRVLPLARSRGAVLFAAGAAWTLLGVLDMHLFGTMHHDSVLHDGHWVAGVVLHGVGLLAATCGLASLLRRSPGPRLREPSAYPAGPVAAAAESRTP